MQTTQRSYQSIIITAIFALLLSQCIEPLQIPATQTNYNYLVVDGFLNAGNDTTKIKLSRTEELSDTREPTAVGHATVGIEGTDGSMQKLTELSNGLYVIAPTDLKLLTGIKYRLNIWTRFQNDNPLNYASQYLDPKVSPPIDSIQWTEENDGIHFFINTHDPENKTHYYRWDFNETWQYSSIDYSQMTYDHGVFTYRNRSDTLYYCWKTRNSLKIFSGATTNLSEDRIANFPVWFAPENWIELYFGYSLRVRQRAITDKAYTYYQELEKNTNNVGTLYAPTPSNISGNIYCLNDPDAVALGWFDISTVTEYRTTVYRQQLRGPSTPYLSTHFYDDCTKNIVLPEDVTDELMKDNLVIMPNYGKGSILLNYIIAPARCLDCRFAGGTNVKPPYWR